MQAYLEASTIHEEEAKKKKLEEHVVQIKKHMKDLSSKEYWKQLAVTPEYVILFLPAEAFFSAALQIEPTLLETAAQLNIVLATPTTLIAILRAVAYSWKQENVSKSAMEIAKIGKELYERLLTMNQHWSVLGKNLSQSVDAYNQALSSFESRVLVSARKLKEFGVSSSSLALEEIVKTTRSIEQEKLVE
jgi:DNA recombination protein RmuC